MAWRRGWAGGRGLYSVRAMTRSAVHADLRAATALAHQAVETDADVEGRLRDLDRRAEAVADLGAFHSAVEAGVAPWAGTIAELGYAARSRAALIPGSATPASVRRRPDGLGEALGWLYVAEGSMLGGRVMRQAMRRDGIPLEGLEFLDPHGDETGPRWRALLAMLEFACASGRAARAEVVKGAADAFALAYELLVPPRRPESVA